MLFADEMRNEEEQAIWQKQWGPGVLADAIWRRCHTQTQNKQKPQKLQPYRAGTKQKQGRGEKTNSMA